MKSLLAGKRVNSVRRVEKSPNRHLWRPTHTPNHESPEGAVRGVGRDLDNQLPTRLHQSLQISEKVSQQPVSTTLFPKQDESKKGRVGACLRSGDRIRGG